MQSEEYKKGYRAGYRMGSMGRWGAHVPPAPPDDKVSELMEAARALRDKADVYCATLPNDDEMRADFEPLIDRIDEAFQKIGEWLADPESR